MPNHITNILTIQTDEEQVRDILEAVKSDETGIGSVDFNKIIPMPESLNIESSTRAEHGLELYRSFLLESAAVAYSDVQNTEPSSYHNEAVTALLKKYQELTKDDPELLQLGRRCYENIQNYGYTDWYSWSIENWGTKWNSYGYNDFPNYQEGDSEIRFLTAWSAPHPVLEKLSELYPDVIFTHRWADEDFGHNVGERDYHSGQVIGENVPAGGSVEAVEKAADILDIKLNCEESGSYLSADESCYFYLDPDETYELIELFDKPALFSNGRITASEIPKGLYCYDLRSDDDGNGFATIEPKVRVNHAGSVITDFRIDFGDEGYIGFNEDTSPNFLSEHITIGQYMQCDYETREEFSGDMGGIQP